MTCGRCAMQGRTLATQQCQKLTLCTRMVNVLYLIYVHVVSAYSSVFACFSSDESMPYDTGKFVGFVHRWDDNELTFFDHRLQTVQLCTCDNLEAVENASGTVL